MVLPSADTSSSSDLRALVAAGYDHVAPAYLAFSIRQAATSARHAYLDKLLARLPPRAAVLELGCGAGILCTKALVAHGHAVTGVDISAAQIALARENVPGAAALLCADMTALEFEPGTFDAVVSFYALFHLPRAEQGAMVAKAAGWLRAGGLFMCNLHTEEGDVYREDWMGARMFSSGLGVAGNSAMVAREEVGLRVVEDAVVGEKVGPDVAKFQWVLAIKRGEGDAEDFTSG